MTSSRRIQPSLFDFVFVLWVTVIPIALWESPAQHRRRSAPASPSRRVDAAPRATADRRQLLLHPRRHAVRGLRVGQRGALRLGPSARRTRRRGGAGRAGAGADLRAGGALPPVAAGSSRCWPISPPWRRRCSAPPTGWRGRIWSPCCWSSCCSSSWRSGGPALALVVPPLFWVWTNLHGGFTYGLMLIGMYRGRRSRGVADQPPATGVARPRSASRRSRCCSPSAA